MKSKVESHLRENNVYWRTPEFIQFTGTSQYRVLRFLMAHIVREVNDDWAPTGAIRIYNQFFKKGMLCASYSLSNIAKIFGWSSEGYVSRLVHRLEKMKLVTIQEMPNPIGQRNVYILGHYTGTYGEDDYQETLFFDVYFSALAKAHKQRQVEQRIEAYKGPSGQKVQVWASLSP